MTPVSLTVSWLPPTILTNLNIRITMIPRALLITLVFALPILVVTFGVVLGASALANPLGDTAGSYGLFWFAIAAFVLVVIDVLLLAVVLGIRALEERRDENRP